VCPSRVAEPRGRLDGQLNCWGRSPGRSLSPERSEPPTIQ
jgi:hypothetical protein